MNTTTIGNIPSSNWKRIKGNYVAAVAGVAIAVTAAVAFAPTTQPGQHVAPARTSISAVTRTVDVPHQYFYIVATEAERGALVHEGAENVILAGTKAHMVLLGEGTRELIGAGVEHTIIDMTNPARIVAPAAPKASEADIAASVLSTELANFGN